MASIAFPSIAKKATLSDGTTYGYVHILHSAVNKPTFLLLHGYPSSSHDWRKQIDSLSQKGYGIIAPDLLGYGDTDKPSDPSSYRMKVMAGHIIELLDIEKIDKAVAVAHDWGVGLLSRLPTYHADRFYGIVAISVGYIEPGSAYDIDAFNELTQKLFGYTAFGYWPWHNTDEAVEDCDENPASVFHLVYPSTPELWKTTFCPIGKAQSFVKSGERTLLPPWSTPSEYTIWMEIFTKGGFRGPMNWYKAGMRGVNIADEKDIPYERKFCDLPALLVVAERDYATRADMQVPRSREWCRELRVETLDCGHWIQLEKADELTALLEGFAREVVKV